MNIIKLFLIHLVWPLKGLIYIEVYCLVWAVMLLKSAFYGAGLLLFEIIIIVIAIAIIIGRTNQIGKAGASFFYSVLNSIFWFLTLLLRSWSYLLIGTLNGRIASAPNQHLPTRLVWDQNQGLFKRITMEESQLPLHYRIGRGLYRGLFMLLSMVPVGNATIKAVIARILALAITLWGVWDIPRFLMN